MSAEEVLAQHRIDPHSWRAGHDGWWGCTCDPDVACDADHQLEVLKAAGYAVVELPKGDFSGPVLQQLPPAVVRRWGLILLAAADQAEAVWPTKGGEK